MDFDPVATIPGFIPFAGGTTYSGRISLPFPAAVLGKEGTLYFDLVDELEAAATIAAVDNVSADPTRSVPVPATPALILIGVAAAFVRLQRRRAESESSKA